MNNTLELIECGFCQSLALPLPCSLSPSGNTMSLRDGIGRLDQASAFEHLQAIIANGPDLSDLDEWDDILTSVAAFCKSGSVLTEIEAFCVSHADDAGFLDDSSEYPLSWTPLHQRYTVLVESLLEGFLSAQGFSAHEFYAACSAALQKTSRSSRDAMFVQMLLASTEFEEFVGADADGSAGASEQWGGCG